MRRVAKDLWAYVREAPTGLPTVFLGSALLVLGLIQGSGSPAAFLWPIVVGCGAGLMLAIEFRASAAGSACAIGALLAVVSEYALFDTFTPLTEFNLMSLALTSGLLAAAPAWAMMLIARKRQQGGDRYVLALVPVVLAIALWAWATRR